MALRLNVGTLALDGDLIIIPKHKAGAYRMAEDEAWACEIDASQFIERRAQELLELAEFELSYNGSYGPENYKT